MMSSRGVALAERAPNARLALTPIYRPKTLFATPHQIQNPNIIIQVTTP